MMDIEVVLLQIVWLKKNTSDGRAKNENKISNKKLSEELHKLIIKKFKKRRVHSPFIDNI